ncbi:RagB/SusD family nutrient uptake outer membrane protein [Flavicella sp.]|uniref:RagB/SusD family nutrient uptake outer membrane protein n=1 Tax=Flavicella sp. TaxID=2957742 RepID=UPI003019EDE0
MKTIYKILSITIVLVISQACSEEFLDIKPEGPVESDFWQTADQADQGLLAAYNPLQTEATYGRAEWFFTTTSDDYWVGRNKASIREWELFNMYTDIDYYYSHWQDFWSIIKRSGDVLRNVPDMDITDAEKNRLTGEAHFLTGFAYFNLITKYGGMPIYDYLNAPSDFYISRSSTEETYAYIEKQLLEAVNKLQHYSIAPKGRATKGSALGMLSKVLIYQEKYEEVIEYSDVLFESGYYELYKPNSDPDTFEEGYENYIGVFQPDANNCSEQLFAVQGKAWTGTTGGPITSIVFMPQNANNGWNYFHPVPALTNSFSADDPRKKATVFIKGEDDDFPYKDYGGAGNDIYLYTPDETNDTDMNFKKFAHAYSVEGYINWEGNNNISILRLSDVYLLRAEAEIELNGDGAGDIWINLVRERVGLEPISNASLVQLKEERRWELAGELQRYYDIIRWDDAKDIFHNTTIDEDPRGARTTFDPIKHSVFPIPINAINASKETLEQNPMY